jgi:hypothetical protein
MGKVSKKKNSWTPPEAHVIFRLTAKTNSAQLLIKYKFIMIFFSYVDGALQCSESIVISKYYHDSQRALLNKITYIASSGSYPVGGFITYLLSRHVYEGKLDFYYYLGLLIGTASLFGKIHANNIYTGIYI